MFACCLRYITRSLDIVRLLKLSKKYSVTYRNDREKTGLVVQSSICHLSTGSPRIKLKEAESIPLMHHIVSDLELSV